MLRTAPTLPALPKGKPNPDYREDWKQVHDVASKRREEAFAAKDQVIARLHKRIDGDLDLIQALNAEWEAAQQICMDSLDTYQHRTFEDALDWLNRTLCSRSPVALPDVQEFSHVKQLISAVYEKHRRQEWERSARKRVMELADPTRFAPFAGAQTWLVIGAPVGRARWDRNANRAVRYTTCKVGDVRHVAMQSVGPLVTVINDCEFHIERYLQQEVREWTARGWFGRSAIPNIQFYTYVAPTDAIKEMFDRVDIEPALEPGKAISVAGWTSVGCVPAALRPDWLPGGLAPIAAQLPSESE